MDAPTTKSADNGSSGDDGGGWFTPRKRTTNPAAPAEQPTPEQPTPEQFRPEPAREQSAQSQEQPTPPGSGYEGPWRDGSAREHRIPEARRPADALSTPSRTPANAVASASPSASAPSAPSALSSAGTAEPETVSGPAPASSFFSRPAGTALAQPPAASRTASAAEPGPRTAPAASSVPAAPTGATAPAAPTAAAPTAPAAPTAAVSEPSPDAVLIQRTMAEVGPVADKVTSYFYALLFLRHPDLRMLFPASMDTQRDRLLKALLTAAENLDNTEALVSYLKNLGRGHRKYGTEPEHYPAVGEALIGSLSRYASSTWDEATEAAWVRTYTTISQIMIDAAAEDEQRAPAWWFGEVVSHERRTPDIAVITVRPDQPYPFRAGQYASLETPWWPRVWRHYSFASAPRADGLLSFHVKAVPAGWVSGALVHRARPGDTLRLGPPAGSMTVDHGKHNGLLCVGGGTGIAPIKALVEDVAEHGDRRPVEVFYGARSDHDLYDIDTMLQLQQTHPWLSVRPVIDRFDQQSRLGQLPDAVREFGPWNEYDAYLSGPPGLIRNGVHVLRDAGIPVNRIRHDSLEELVAAGA
ncbi:globin domain-containing protein [Streptomyces cavernicola]|uniref:nitric oxide dioxygenase n=1 Tax=Streptomyces cavernicola TaxID=3043613 RepID=A0ABT6S3Q9_9ACTN|nr:globin domain-containing protein [Streptomyces sp. B-S-A6]MDI3402732.1 globin domain-containing protein [Streptomyces sp. B-S-A6]